jgi:hypothetical protein
VMHTLTLPYNKVIIHEILSDKILHGCYMKDLSPEY